MSGDGTTIKAATPDWIDSRATLSDAAAADRLPYCLRILLENCVRNQAFGFASDAEIAKLAQWRPGGEQFAIPLRVTRVVMPDSSGLPALIDIAALPDAVARHGGDPMRCNRWHRWTS